MKTKLVDHAVAYPHLWAKAVQELEYGHPSVRNERVTPSIDAAKRTGVALTTVPPVENLWTTNPVAGDAVYFACMALDAWPDSEFILGLPPDAGRLLAGVGDHAAVLMLPAVLAMSYEKT